MKTKKALKIIALVLALVLTAGLAFFVNALVGNPLSKHLAKTGAEKHLEQMHPDKDFYIDRITYNFKDGDYHVFVESPSSPDSSFSISTDLAGNIRWDSYEDRVVRRVNTSQRINTEYRQAVDNVFESKTFPYNVNFGYGDIEFLEAVNLEQPITADFAIVIEELELDGYYDIGELGRKAGHLVAYIYDEDVSVKRLCEILLAIKETMNNAGVEFKVIDCVLEPPKPEEGYEGGYTGEDRVEVEDFLYEDIYEKDLEKRVEKANEKMAEYHAEQDRIKQEEIEAYQQSVSDAV